MKKNDVILITNDDGFKAKGIKVLRSIAQKLSDDVWEFLLYPITLEKVTQ